MAPPMEATESASPPIFAAVRIRTASPTNEHSKVKCSRKVWRMFQKKGFYTCY